MCKIFKILKLSLDFVVGNILHQTHEDIPQDSLHFSKVICCELMIYFALD